MTDRIQLHVDGLKYGGWQSVSVTRDLSSMAADFELSLTWKFPAASQQPIREGSECFITIGGERVMTGYIDDWIPSYDEKSVSITVSGRSKTGDLVDCSVEYPSGQFTNQTLTQIANVVCAPFGIRVVVDTDVGAAFSRIQVEQGETVHELLTRLAKQRGVLLTCNAYGDLVITRASKQVLDASLELGRNIKAARGRFSQRDRFSKYTVKASGYGGGEGDALPLSAIGGQKATIADVAIKRYRPKIIVNDEIATAEGASKRGQWEKQRAIGSANLSEITVTDWRIDTTQALWDTNKLIPVKDEIQGIDRKLLIKTVMFSAGEAGKLTVLGLVPPESMDIPAEAAKQTKVDAKWVDKVVDRGLSK